MLPLFKQYPGLASRFPHLALGQFPTPVARLARVEADAGLRGLYIKRDDLSGACYGGNKVRKLEFLLAAAHCAGAREVITFGFAGSNHALATAIYAGQLGMTSISMLLPQVNAHYVRRNLLASHAVRAELRPCANWLHLILATMRRVVRGMLRNGVAPHAIPAGGSCPLGVIGYVNAAFELRDQIAAGELPEPDVVYVAMGSMGTAAGLMLGLRAAGLKSEVVPVRVIEREMARARGLRRLLRRTALLLHQADPAFPEYDGAVASVPIRDDALGRGYACFTEEGQRAAAIVHEECGIVLNGAYTAKAFAALLGDMERQALRDKTVLFWNTYNSRDLSSLTADIDYHALPASFHRYFEQEVQPLDQNGLDR
ncbi:MAG: hypothetical protein A3K19_13435 [Lentisphaerae bacterium RIFOXYB12_FULL_65_16]|nr:MAG: hypothetical protein A3K18_28955 [Lentisphaerae bacterium RIFOXYA12_64_32]OGV86296.1 MAG: hypothetical protein A3K19_13435 [Lentisphaerae bacterium RIFOXYB12_FULL_65_16]